MSGNGIRITLRKCFQHLRWLGGVSLAATAATAEPLPRVWIFNGLPGDEAHHAFYGANLRKIRTTLQNRYGIPAERITMLYGPKEAGYDGECTRDALLDELGKAAKSTHEADAGPVWIILQGHANPVAGGAMFNLPGPDASPRDMAGALAGAKEGAEIVILATTTCSAAFMKPLADPGRLIITASSARDPEDETEFPRALAEVLENPKSDSNGDGLLSVEELFLACHARVQALYEVGGFMIREHAQLDGNGDGIGTRRPSAKDAEPASKVGLRVAGAKREFE